MRLSRSGFTITGQQMTRKKPSLNFTEKAIKAAVSLLCNCPDFLCFAAVGALSYGWPGAAIGIAACTFIRSQIVPQDPSSRTGLLLSSYEEQGDCRLQGCEHC